MIKLWIEFGAFLMVFLYLVAEIFEVLPEMRSIETSSVSIARAKGLYGGYRYDRNAFKKKLKIILLIYPDLLIIRMLSELCSAYAEKN